MAQEETENYGGFIVKFQTNTKKQSKLLKRPEVNDQSYFLNIELKKKFFPKPSKEFFVDISFLKFYFTFQSNYQQLRRFDAID